MATLYKLLEVKVDRGNSCQSLGSPIGAGPEGAGDPMACASLHLPERVQGPLHGGPLVEPESGPIGSYGEDTGAVELPLVRGSHAMHRVAKGQHGPHRGEGLVGVSLNMFPECETMVKKETQVAPKDTIPSPVLALARAGL